MKFLAVLLADFDVNSSTTKAKACKGFLLWGCESKVAVLKRCYSNGKKC